MAKRRMLSSDVISTDAFLGMSLRARELYVHLNLAGDDDGFVSNALMVTRSVGATKKHLKELLDGGYLLQFGGDLYLLTHWLINNQIRKARYVPTIHQKEFALVKVEHKKYRFLTEEELAKKADEERARNSEASSDSEPEEDAIGSPNGVQNGSVLETQVSKEETRTEKDSSEKNNSGEGNKPLALITPSVENLKDYALEIGYQGFNAEKFLAYYGSRDWKHPDGTPVSDWRKQVDLWKAREGDFKPLGSSSKQIAWQPANQNDYDFEELEKKLLAN